MGHRVGPPNTRGRLGGPFRAVQVFPLRAYRPSARNPGRHRRRPASTRRHPRKHLRLGSLRRRRAQAALRQLCRPENARPGPRRGVGGFQHQPDVPAVGQRSDPKRRAPHRPARRSMARPNRRPATGRPGNPRFPGDHGASQTGRHPRLHLNHHPRHYPDGRSHACLGIVQGALPQLLGLLSHGYPRLRTPGGRSTHHG